MTDHTPAPPTTATAGPSPTHPTTAGVRRALPWILGGTAGWALITAVLWAVRPRWGICYDGVDDGGIVGGCVDGAESTIALTTSVIGLVVLCALIVVAVLARSRARLPLLLGLTALLGIVGVIGAFASAATPVPLPDGPYPYS